MHTTLAMFRRYARIEEEMMRAVMPRLAAADTAPLPKLGQDSSEQPRRTWRGRTLVTKGSFTLAEVVNG